MPTIIKTAFGELSTIFSATLYAMKSGLEKNKKIG